MVTSYAFGFPRLGKKREYKKVIENYWKGQSSEKELREDLDRIQEDMLTTYARSVDRYPVGEMTFYDPMFDTALMIGLYRSENLEEYYDFCRGKNALEMTKWFNTNYHYLVPDFSNEGIDRLALNWNKPSEYVKKFNRGIPYLIGPFTFLKLSKGAQPDQFSGIIETLGEIYRQLIDEFDEVHMDEPGFVMDLSREEVRSIQRCYRIIGTANCKINLFTYYDGVDFLKELFELPVGGIGLDFVHGDDNLKKLKSYGFPDDKLLVAGLVDGRNVWRTDIARSVEVLDDLSNHAKNLAVSNGAPLYHLPVTTVNESLDPELMENLAFAEERLHELSLITQAHKGLPVEEWDSPTDYGTDESVTERISALKEKDFVRPSTYRERKGLQEKRLNLPPFPTTTIGSFPQTSEVRKKRAAFKSRKISSEEYTSFIREKITELIRMQEELGLDVLVHGEFERSDMVEFFAEKLAGIATTKNGWILSYGTRGYRPPIIYGDVSRPKPLTIEEIAYAQSLTDKPVKGMLTGPVTILAWSYVREDVPVQDVAFQIGLGLQDEIHDYENAGIRIVQVDEPAFREKAPIKKRDWDDYFDWAVKSFRLATKANPETQIHTHMCYSEFGEIIDKISQLDFDVIFIEATRSKGNVIQSFERISFDRQIGLGVWDIHSPAVPGVKDMKEIITRASRVLPKENLWINPDCGLKTRGWEETKVSLKNMITLGESLRE